MEKRARQIIADEEQYPTPPPSPLRYGYDMGLPHEHGIRGAQSAEILLPPWAAPKEQ